MAPTYALAEQAADLIINPPSSPSPSGTNTNTNGGASQTGSGSGSQPTGGAGAMRSGGMWVAMLVGFLGAALAL